MSEKLYRIGVGFGLIVMKDGKILMGLRNSDPEKADSEMHGEGTWTLIGGKLEYKESFEEGVAREAKEETGIDVSVEDLELVSLSSDIAQEAHFITACFVAKKFGGEPKTMEPEEIMEWRWFDPEDLPENLFPPSKKAIDAWKSGKVWVR